MSNRYLTLAQILADHVAWEMDHNKGKCANLRDANLRGANLRGADLRGANLSGADLSGADLYDANLYDADLYGANLRDANLSGADLSGANLRDANLSDANLRGTISIIAGGAPNGWFTFGWLRAGRLSVRVGCREIGLAKGREYWAGKDDRREVLAALAYVEAVAKLRGWRTEE